MRFKAVLAGTIPQEKLVQLSGGFSVIGDIAVVTVPQELGAYKKQIAAAIITGRRHIRCVLNKVTKLEGDDRVPHFEVLAGEGTETAHREYGYLYRLDVTEVFFNTRLSFERKRVTHQIQAGERVLVPFAGAGPFVVPAAARGASILAVEKNRNACRWLLENVRQNNVSDRVDIICGDAFAIPVKTGTAFDRIILPAPYGADTILEALIPLVKSDGRIHFYTFKKEFQIEGHLEIFRDMGCEILFLRRCGNVAPGVNRWVFDLVKCS